MKARLKDLGTIFTGNTPSKRVDEYWDNSDIKFIKPDIIKDELCVIYSANEYISAGAKNASRIVPANSVLVTCIGNIGRVGITEEEVAFNQQINAIVPNRTIIPKYLAYAIYANRKQLQAIANAPVVPIINKTQFSDFEISICESLEKQNKIVRILDTISEIITHNKKKIEALDNLIKARFVEMFKDCIESVKLEQVVTSIKTGKLDANVEKKDGKYPFFTCDAIPKRIDDYAFDAEAILISGNGSRVGHVHYYKGKFNAYQRTYVLSDFRHDIDLSYLKTYLENELRPYIARNKKGSAVPYITLPMLQNFKLPFPPLEKQKEFATFVAQIDKSKFALSNELAMGNFYIRLIHDCIMHGCIDLRVPQ